MELHIVSDGTPFGTKVVDSRTGEAVENIRCVDIHIHAKDGVRAKLEFVLMKVEINVVVPGRN